MSEKSILEQALLQVQTLEEAVKQNAKGILASTMRQELNELLRETEEKEEKEEETNLPEEEKEANEQDTPEDEDTDTEDTDTEDTDTEDTDTEDTDTEDDEDEDDEDEDEMGSEDTDTDGEDADVDSEDADMEGGDTDMGGEMPDMDSEDMGGMPDVGGDMGGPDESSDDDDDVMDMTGSSDHEVLKVFKALKAEDGIVVKKDGNHLDVDMGEDEFIIKLDGDDDTDESLDEESMDEEESSGYEMENTAESSDLNDEETIYEIELDEEDEETKEEEGVKKVEATEAARTKSNPHGNKGGLNRAGLKSKKKYKAGSGVFGLNEEFNKLKKQNSEYKKALVLFKEKLNEVAVFNANLAYATRLFTEHSTTKNEKLNILKRFDTISTLNESKNLYNVIKTELETKKPVTESVVEKISSMPTSSASKDILSESKAYESPQFRRMKDLMAKIK